MLPFVTLLQYPTAVAHQLFKLIRRDGLAKISYSLVSVRLLSLRMCPASTVADSQSASTPSLLIRPQMNVPQAVLKGVMQPYFQHAQAFRVEGSDF